MSPQIRLEKEASQKTTADRLETTEYLGRPIPKPGRFKSYCQVVKNNIESNGILSGFLRTIAQANYRSRSRILDSILESAYQGFADSIVQTFSQHELVLNFSNVWADGRPGSTLIPHVRLRDFEAPMCRTCYLTGHTDEITEFYQIGTEIDTYRTKDELVDKTRFYLNHPAEAEKMREAGYQRSLQSHTWKHRFRQLFKAIGLKE